MQGKTIHLDSGRERVHPLHDFETLDNFDQLNAHVRTDNWTVMGSKKASRASLVDVVQQARNCLGGSKAAAGRETLAT